MCKCSARYFVWPPRVRTSCVRCSLESLVLAGARPISYLRFLCTLTFLPPVARRLCSEWRVMPIFGPCKALALPGGSGAGANPIREIMPCANQLQIFLPVRTFFAMERCTGSKRLFRPFLTIRRGSLLNFFSGLRSESAVQIPLGYETTWCLYMYK